MSNVSNLLAVDLRGGRIVRRRFIAGLAFASLAALVACGGGATVAPSSNSDAGTAVARVSGGMGSLAAAGQSANLTVVTLTGQKTFEPATLTVPVGTAVNWVNGATMITSGKKIDLQQPSQLMFTRINGRDSLAGAAYAYFTAVGDTVHPPTFDGNPAWHEHAMLAPPGQTLVMLHVWFVPSPDGPFAGTNPNLPFWAVGLAAPDPARMKDAGFSSRVRRAGLALAEVADSAAMFSPLARRNRLVAPSGLSAMRDTVRALLPEFRAAEQAKDATRFDRAVDKAAAQWDAMQAAYVGVGRTDAGRQRIEEYFQMLLGQHGEQQL